MAEPKNY
ncbi:hypothetical protein VTL71DRAFT_1565 [Oculimacula yallundae]